MSKLNISYSQFNFDNLSIQKERDIIQHKKEELEKKNIQILREHKFLRDRITKLEQQLKDKRDMEKKFNKDIDDLNQETLSLVEEIEKMANVNIKFNGKEYLLSCDDGQEESLKKLVTFLDKKYLELKEKLGNIGENKLLLITSIKLIDEHFDLKRRIGDQKKKLDNLSNKFKELKTLAIEYKDNKEIEIHDLNEKIDAIKNIEETNLMYENMLDKTTESLEKIIKNAEMSSNTQQ